MKPINHEPFEPHSPYLRASSTGPVSKEIDRGKRAVTVLTFVTLIAFIMVIIKRRVLHPEGAGYPLYWLHDHVILPVYGYTYLNIHPWGPALWGAVGAVLVVWALTYTSGTSLLRDTQYRLAQTLLSAGDFHPVLLSGCRFLAGKGYFPRWLTATAYSQWRIWARRLTDHDSHDNLEDGCELQQRLALIHAELALLDGALPIEKLRAAATLCRAQALALQLGQKTEAPLFEKLRTCVQQGLALCDVRDLMLAKQEPADFSQRAAWVNFYLLLERNHRERGRENAFRLQRRSLQQLQLLEKVALVLEHRYRFPELAARQEADILKLPEQKQLEAEALDAFYARALFHAVTAQDPAPLQSGLDLLDQCRFLQAMLPAPIRAKVLADIEPFIAVDVEPLDRELAFRIESRQDQTVENDIGPWRADDIRRAKDRAQLAEAIHADPAAFRQGKGRSG